MDTKNKHGGKRPGAGRPQSDNKKIRRNLSFDVATWETLGDLAKKAGKTRSKYIGDLISQK